MEMNGRFTIMENNNIFNNTSTTDAPYKALGGGIQCGRLTSSTGKAIIRNNYIHDNEVHSELSFGGGLFYLLLYDSPVKDFQPLEIYNNLIVGNHSDYRGGGACFWYLGVWDYYPPLDPVLTNNTIVDNFAETGSGLCAVDAEIALFNNILWNELADESGTEISDELFKYCAPMPAWCLDKNHAIIHAAYNNIRGGWPGEGNIAYDPFFEEGTFQLSDSSANLGRGIDSIQINDAWYFAPSPDYEGNSRPNAIDLNVDLGAYESAYELVLLPVADLSYIGFNNETISPEFHADTLEYELLVADTTTSSAALQVIPYDMLANVDINYPANLTSENETDRTATILVASSDETTQKTYSVLFHLLSTNSALQELMINPGILEPEFDPEITTYEVALPPGTTDAPVISCKTSHENADYIVSNAFNIISTIESFRTSKVKVTSEYGAPFTTAYEIVFNVGTVGKDRIEEYGGLRIYPNPTTSLLTIETESPDHYSINITTLNGQQILSGEMKGTTRQLDLSSFQSGIYFITIRSKDFVATKKIVKL